MVSRDLGNITPAQTTVVLDDVYELAARMLRGCEEKSSQQCKRCKEDCSEYQSPQGWLRFQLSTVNLFFFARFAHKLRCVRYENHERALSILACRHVCRIRHLHPWTNGRYALRFMCGVFAAPDAGKRLGE